MVKRFLRVVVLRLYSPSLVGLKWGEASGHEMARVLLGTPRPSMRLSWLDRLELRNSGMNAETIADWQRGSKHPGEG